MSRLSLFSPLLFSPLIGFPAVIDAWRRTALAKLPDRHRCPRSVLVIAGGEPQVQRSVNQFAGYSYTDPRDAQQVVGR